MTYEYSASNVGKDLQLDNDRWNRMASEAEVAKTVEAFQKKNIQVIVVANRAEALEKIKHVIPKGAEVMNGSSTTLAEIGFVEYLKTGQHGWKNRHETILAEKDQSRQSDLRREAVAAEYFLASANAIAQTGDIVSCDASGSRTGAFLFGAKHLIIVAGTNKIVPTMEDAIRRIREYAFPLENVRAQKVYGMGSATNKWVILGGEYDKTRTTIILVKESLGY